LPLAREFPPADYAQWRKLVDGVLKGASFEQRLVAKTYDGLAIEPLSPRKADACPVLGRRPGTAWAIMQRVDHPDPAAANAMALIDLENGANGLAIILAGAVGGYGFGLAADEGAIARALEGVHLDAGIALDLDTGLRGEIVAPHIAALVKHRGTDPVATTIRFGLDPIGAAAKAGCGAAPWGTLRARFAATIAELRAQ